MAVVVLKARISGTRDGVDWPLPGETVDLPDGEAADLVAAGLAEAVAVEPKKTRSK